MIRCGFFPEDVKLGWGVAGVCWWIPLAYLMASSEGGRYVACLVEISDASVVSPNPCGEFADILDDGPNVKLDGYISSTV